MVSVRFLGSGDAFGSGGRFQACVQVTARAGTFLLDCGASSMIAMRRFGVDPNAIGTVLVSHLHGDHFGGLPFMILDAQLVSRRTAPLTVAGPPGLRKRLVDAMEVFFPDSSATQQRFALGVVELEPGTRTDVNGISVTPFVVSHASGAPPFALRLECDGKVIAYSGDAEWADGLVSPARDADLFVCEAYFVEKRVKYHLDLRTLEAHLAEIRPKRLVVTHMSRDVLDLQPRGAFEMAADGMTLEV